ncbi:MAG TPA: hypothetical protein VGD94_19205 [Vicinamibacterales bacterium]
METLTSSLAVIAAGVVGIVAGTFTRSPLRLSLLCVGGALVIGPLSNLASEEFLRIAGAGIAIGLGTVAIVNSAAALIRWKIQTRHT